MKKKGNHWNTENEFNCSPPLEGCRGGLFKKDIHFLFSNDYVELN